MDKLTSRSRVNSPAPSATSSRSSSVARHSLPPPSSLSMASSSSSRHSIHEYRSHDSTLSGSETERDEQSGSNHFHPSVDDDDISATPPAVESMLSDPVRQRRISAPSPGKSALKLSRSTSGRASSPGPSNTPRKRASVALPPVDDSEDYLERQALASSTSSRRSRQPLPREFLGRSNSDEIVSTVAMQDEFTLIESPQTTEGVLVARGSPSPRAAASSLSPTATPHSSRPPRATNLAARSSTVRELTRKHQTRWFSEDLSSAASTSIDADDEEPGGTPSGGLLRVGRRQILRGGSAESPLAAFAVGERSLVGEGLRAAGIGARRRELGDDVFATEGVLGRQGSGAATFGTSRKTNDQVNGKSKGRLADRDTEPPVSLVISTADSPRTPASRLSGTIGQYSRPSTSMTGYDDATNPPKTAPPALRTYKSAYALPERARDRAGGASITRSRTVIETRDRTSPPGRSSRAEAPTGSTLDRRITETPIRSGTLSRASGTAIAQSTEHTRLMFNALNMFEDRLTHIPSFGTIGTTTIPEVFRSAKAMAQETEKLNILLRDSTNRAMNEHIQASVDDSPEGAVDMAESWRQISGEFRESLRVSDELVRMMTEFLLGVGKALRDLGGSDSSPAQHLRTMSLDDDAVRRLTPERGINGARSGTEDSRSTGSRRSWEPPPRTSSRLEATPLRRDPSDSTSQSLAQPRTRKISFDDELRSSTRPSASTNPPPSATNRLFSPLEQRDRALKKVTSGLLVASDSLETVRAEPSPTPASRNLVSNTRLSSLGIPPSRPSLPTVPSESRLERVAERTHRSKPSTTSNSTVRAAALKFPALKTAGATTALTSHSVHQSPISMPSPLNRSQSSTSSARDSPVVSFSRSTTTALSELQERQRTISGASMDDSPLDAVGVRSAERDLRHRTVGYQNQVLPSDSPAANDSVILGRAGQRRERRRTVTELFSRS
jgi:hypothetical protein